MLLSGHKRKDTLLRYLGWGAASGEATRAAVRRLKLLNNDDGSNDDEESSGDEGSSGDEIIGGGEIKFDGLKMSLWSGEKGVKGRRVDGIPWPLKPPSFSDLGIRDVERGVVGDEGVGAEEWPLHVKNVSLIDYEKILETSKGTRFFPLLSHCFSFLNEDVFYERKIYLSFFIVFLNSCFTL
jgi:hypothetical protein